MSLRDMTRARDVHPVVALMVIAGAQLMVVLDVTIVNVALPHIQAGLGFSRTGLAWVIDAYTLAFGGLLLLGGRAGDILGRRRMFVIGVLLFAGASLVGGFATSTAWLIASRLALAAPVVLPKGERNPGRFDFPGAITVTAGVGSLVYGFIHAASSGWGDTATLASFAAAAVLLATFFTIESRSRQPLLPLHLFAERARWGSYTVMLMGGASMFGVLFFLTQFLQGPLGYSPLRTGLAFLPLNLIIITSAQVSSRLVPRTGPRPLILFGTSLMVLGLLWLSRLGAGSGYATLVLPAMATIGVGIGQIFVPVTLTAVSGVQRWDSGVASALLNVSQQVGGTLGLSALVTVSATATASQLARVASGGSVVTAAAGTRALLHGWANGFELAAVFAVVALLAAFAVLRPRGPQSQSSSQASIDEDIEVVPAEEAVLWS